MERSDGVSDDDEAEGDEKFGDALAALAVDDAPDIDPVTAVRETRES